MAGRGGCSLQSSVLAISVLYLLVLGLLLALATVLALDPGPGLATLLELVDTADSRLAGSAVAASVRGLVTSAQHHLALPLTLLVVLLAATVMLAAGAVFSRPLLLLPWLGNLVTSMSPSLHTCPPHPIYTRVLLTMSPSLPTCPGLLLLLDLLAASLLVLAMASLEDAWLQTITFLIVAPMLTLAAACWATGALSCLYLCVHTCVSISNIYTMIRTPQCSACGSTSAAAPARCPATAASPRCHPPSTRRR